MSALACYACGVDGLVEGREGFAYGVLGFEDCGPGVAPGCDVFDEL